MTPKQETMKEICDIIHAQAKTEGMGLDYEMFSRKNMRLKHDILLKCLDNLKKNGIKPVPPTYRATPRQSLNVNQK